MHLTEDQLNAARARMEGHSLERLRATVDDLEARLNGVFEQAGEALDFDQVTSLAGATDAEKIQQLSALHAELSAARDLVSEREGLLELRDAIQARNTGGGPADAERPAGLAGNGSLDSESTLDPVPLPLGAAPPEPVDIGERFVTHALFAAAGGFDRAWRQHKNVEIELDLDARNALFETGAGWPPEVIRSGQVVPSAQRPVQVLDLFPMLQTMQAAYKYMEETTFDNAAAERAEGAEAAEAALQLTEKTADIRSIATWIPVTEEQLDDVPGAQAYLNLRLPFMLRQRFDEQVLNGDGTAPNLSGLLNRTGLGAIDKGDGPALDALRKAITNVRITGRARPNAFVLHPHDWQEIQLTKTTDGVYLYGSPADQVVARVWGLPVAESDVLSEGTALCGDFAGYAALITRQGVTLDITDAHASFFIAMKYAVRARLRAGLAVFRPAAFCKVTGL